MVRRFVLGILLGFPPVWLVTSPLPVFASDAVVTSPCNEGAFSTALDTVQSSGGGAVTFNCGAATIVLSSVKLITSNVTLDGGDQITLSGGNATQIFHVIPGGHLTLANVSITNGFGNNGFGNGDGGAVRNDGILTVANSTFRGNSTNVSFSGGAIVSYGPVTITHSLFEDNRGGSGGALYVRFPSAQTVISDTVFRNNAANSPANGWGGAILTWDGAPLTIEGGEIYGNTARNGGGIYNTANSIVTVRGGAVIRENLATGGVPEGGGIHNSGTLSLGPATVMDNTAHSGGGIYNAGTMSLVDATISGNRADGGYGGGIENSGGNGTLDRVTLSGNSAYASGGGIHHYNGMLTLTNTTVSGNDSGLGGGIDSVNNGSMSLTFVTIAGNSAAYGAGIAKVAAGTVTLRNVLLDNTGERGNCWRSDNGTTLTSLGFNLSSDTDFDCYLTQPSDYTGVDPQLSPLGDWGGATWTMIPAATSAAIDRAQCLASVSIDQRGIIRPQGAACDIGAVEVPPGTRVLLPIVIK